MRVLLVEDDVPLSNALASFLRGRTFTVDQVTTLADAHAALPAAQWAVVLLDLQLPDGDGMTFVPAVRHASADSVIIMLTARDQISDRIRGLDAGADDYMVKPFDPEELMARLRAVERRINGEAGAVVRIGLLEIDLARMTVLRRGVPVHLTRKEWAVLRVLAIRPDRMHSQATLLNALYGFDSENGSNTLEVFISHLRDKLGRYSIRTVRGLGYRLTGVVD
ncbi:response regulator transcription factor [Polaromonas sp.]|uniref:response regulator transcription factor n=1 Tax=Polaromonas sp. TaxID=1869339 RepID=UPI00286B7945|nr:response regulator transcription factor [Polaromonas sp.]